MDYVSELIWGKPRKTVAELVKEQQRMIRRQLLDVDGDYANMSRMEKTTILEIKKAAKENQRELATMHAQTLVRIRSHKIRIVKIKAQLNNVVMELSTVQSTNAIATTMANCVRYMKRMDRRMNITSLQKITRDFEMQMDALGFKNDLMNEALDSTADSELDEEQESENIIGQVFAELNINFVTSAPSVPTQVLAMPAVPSSSTNDLLQQRFDLLK